MSSQTPWFSRTNWCVLALAALALTASAPAQADTPLEYNRDIRPILAEYCFACHGPDSASRKADLRLDQREAAIENGALVPGDADNSQLLARVFSDDSDELMPPPETKKSLTADEKETLKRWVMTGAEYQPHWSLIPPLRPELPSVQDDNWVKTPIDDFVLSHLEAAGLTPASEADPRTLFRRVHLDITGLPPNPDDVTSFVNDYEQRSDDALAEWIERLMDSPEWGEHRARYWLDAARYADTHGMHFDNYREMWPYRDWVIRSFNANQPFDQFVVEQIGGDLLPNPTDDQLIATGFQRCNITTNEGGTIDEENLALYATDRVQTFGWVFLGMTTNCGQCHDHKFDPFTMKDYYSLAAFFRNTTQQAKDGNVKDGRGPVLIVPSEEDHPRWEALPDEIAHATTARDQRKESGRDDFEQWLAMTTPESFEPKIPSDGLLVHLPLTEGEGKSPTNICDPSTPVEATSDISWIADGKLGPAPVIEVDATYVLGQLGDFEKDQGFSYGAWIRLGEDDSGGIIAKIDAANDYRGWDLWQQGKTLEVNIVDALSVNAIKVVTKNSVLRTGQWQHVFATYDGSGKAEGITIFVDGQKVPVKVAADTLKPEASIRTETPLRIGQRSNGQYFSSGAIQDVRIYERTLSPNEVQALFKMVPVQAALATATDQRQSEQQETLYDYYLDTSDPEYASLAQAVVDLEAERDAIKSRSPVTHIQRERMDSSAMAHILIRGEYDRPSDEVQANTPAVLHPLPEGAARNRLSLGQWVVDPANPLTARVTVNRFWQQLYGRGLVETSENFGVSGALPTHPELLDWLAIEFQESGWDVKRFFKLMLMSNTYRQSAVISAEKLEKDRENLLFSRGPRFRMDAEMVRDYALAVSGLLSPKMYGPSVKPYQPEAVWDVVGLPGGDTRNYVQDTGENLYRRTLYNFWKRMAPPPNLEAFNAPSREVCTVRRERTNTPLQAMVTLNDPQFIEAARSLAQNALLDSKSDDSSTVDFIAQRVLGRSMSDEEQTILLADKHDYLEYYQSNTDDAHALINIGDSVADGQLDVPALAAWTMVCNQVLNLDETLNK